MRHRAFDPAAFIRSAVDAVRTAPWLTAERIRIYGRTAAVFGWLALAVIAATSTALVDRLGRPIGTDFSAFYAAGTLAQSGQAASAYDWAALHAMEQTLFGPNALFYSWSYPPFALLPLSLLATLPYLWALALFIGLTFAAYVVVVRRLAPPGREAFWAIVGFPGVFINAGHGQNGFVSAALLGAGLLLLRRRPVLAGVAFGLLAFKPQLALLIPVALAFGRCWAAIASAAATVVVLVGISVVAYGPAPWEGFLAATALSRQAILEDGATGFSRLQSVFGAVRLLGGPSSLAWTLQVVVSVLVMVLVARIWNGRAPPNVKGAVLVIGGLLATPFLNAYDLVLLALPAAMIASSDVRGMSLPWERSAYLAAWLLPTVAVAIAASVGVPLAPLLLAALLMLAVRRAAPRDASLPTAANR
jgi:hypothetical protein